MGWAFGIGRYFGIPVRVHVTLLVLLAVMFAGASSTAIGLQGLFLSVLLFASVLVHELGHALVARRFGVGTKEILLLPIGGAAMLADHPKRPRDELLIALAGPAVSLALAGLSWLGHLALALTALADLAVVNLVLGLFNLVPAFPLDGGRVLRAALALRLGQLRATRAAARLGRLLAVGFIVFALYAGELVLGFIGAFIFIAAFSEERAALIQGVVAARSVVDLLELTPHVLGAGASVADAVAGFGAHPSLAVLPVAFGPRVLGVVHRADALAIPYPAEHGLGELVDKNVVTHDGDAPLLELLTRMSETRSRAAVVTASGEVLGVITLERVLAEIRAAQQALR